SGDRAADRDRPQTRFLGWDSVDTTADDRLGRPVFIDQHRLGSPLPPEGDVLRSELLPTNDERAGLARGCSGIQLIAEPTDMSGGQLDQAVPAGPPQRVAKLLDGPILGKQVH